MQLLISFLVINLFGWTCSYLAEKKGRHPVTWFFIGALFGLIALIALQFLPSFKKEAEIKDTSHSLKIPLMMQSQEWFYIVAPAETIGPISFEKLCELYHLQLVQDNTYVWTNGLPQWHKLSALWED